MISKLEQTALRLRPYRLHLIVAMIVTLVGGFLLARKIDQNDAVAVRTVAMALAWWCWSLFLLIRIYTPENREAIKDSMFPRFASVILNFVAAIIFVSSILVALAAFTSIVSSLVGDG